MIDQFFSALGVAAFSLASYQDGAAWKSGLLAGIAVSWLFVLAMRWAESYSAQRHSP